jgi:hypothetical protein
MTRTEVETEVLTLLQKLPLAQQYSVLAFMRALLVPTGTPGQQLLPFAGKIDHNDLQAMSAAIEKDCEQVHPDEW